MTTLEKKSPCKVNLLLNILGKRPDGFHEVETIMQPVNICDELRFARTGKEVSLTCNEPSLPVDSGNLVHRAATSFLQTAKISDGIKIHLEKKLPLAAGLGGGSGNAATTLLALNEMFGKPLAFGDLDRIAATLGSDVPFFLQSKPALATGRGEKIRPLENFPALRDAFILLVHPGFGISTAWAYQQLANFHAALNGRRGRAEQLISLLQAADIQAAGAEFYNSLEAPALKKFPLLVLFQEFFRANGAVSLMSGSGSTTFALIRGKAGAENLLEKFKGKFGQANWTALVSV